MPGYHFALLADDQRLANEIIALVENTSGESLFTGKLGAATELLGHDTDGLLLLAANKSEHADQIRCIVQEISLRQLPPVVVLIEADGAIDDPSLRDLDKYLAGRVRWPEEAAALKRRVANNLWQDSSFRCLGKQPPGASIARQLASQTPSLAGLVDSVAMAAIYDVPVLITGETGTGKSYLARVIHEHSPRHNHGFLVVSCGALVANLIESELFGHAKGAFTGADRTKEGKFTAAGKGTVLLDEIDTLGLDQQTNLLRVLETGEFEPVGSNATQLCAARILVASNWNLEEGVECGKFRRDLFYRLNVMAFHLPPLRERIEDIAPLARALTAFYNIKFRKNLFDISTDVLEALESYPWPGNIRQLQNIVQQAVIVSSGPELLLSHLPQTVQKHFHAASGGVAGETLALNRQQAERLVIQRALVNSRHSRTEAAQTLGISRVTLYKKMKKYGLMNGKNNSAEVQ
jgi:two-component system response regulator HydG